VVKVEQDRWKDRWLREWKARWRNAGFRFQAPTTVLLLVVVLALFSRFLEWVELRPGVVLSDPVLDVLHPRDFTWPIFAIIYGGVVVGVGALLPDPRRLMMALQAYILMVCIRFAAMFVTPLDPPPGLVPLVDPFVQFFGSGTAPTKDLFFSGHTSTLTLLALTARTRWLRRVFSVGVVLVAAMIVWQHVHYVADVLVAPFIAFASFRTVHSIHQRVEERND
jgi:hypothetical protein